MSASKSLSYADGAGEGVFIQHTVTLFNTSQSSSSPTKTLSVVLALSVPTGALQPCSKKTEEEVSSWLLGRSLSSQSPGRTMSSVPGNAAAKSDSKKAAPSAPMVATAKRPNSPRAGGGAGDAAASKKAADGAAAKPSAGSATDRKAAARPSSPRGGAASGSRGASTKPSTPRGGKAGKDKDAAAAAASTGPAAAAAKAEKPTVLSSEVSAAIHAAARAAADVAHSGGLDAVMSEAVYAAATKAAVDVLDPTGQASLAETEENVPQMQRIENALARALKVNAIRVRDLFQDWDADNNGVISKKEFRAALKGVGVGGSAADHDELFNKWDVDGSGEIDYNELNKAMKKATSELVSRDSFMKTDEDQSKYSDIDAKALVGRKKAGAIAAAKEAKNKAAFRAADRPLSPRSQQLKAAAEREERQRQEEELERLAKEDEDGTTWTAAKWLASRGLAKVVAAALQLPPRVAGDQSHFHFVKTMTRERLGQVLDEAKMGGLVDFLAESVESLSAQRTGSAEQLNDKFATTAKFQMTYGSLSLFYGGLESLLGPPKMYKGAAHDDKSLFNMMEFEHCNDKDADAEFTVNQGLSTTAKTEWEVVVKPDKAKIEAQSYPERDGYREQHPDWCRVPVKLDEMMKAMEEKCNERLRKDGHSEMIREELVAGRLYTGPMYIKYNTVLRSKSGDAAMLAAAKKLTLGNGYPTSIHAINSCVIKLSKLTKAGKVWRGIKDATLPKEFWVPNEMGVRGGIEYGFSSTTTDREQALHYARGTDGDAMTIFEMQMGMVDRGADLSWLSQYPHEREVLLPPLTGIEALGTDVQGGLLVIHSRLSLNLASHTLEQVLSRRRKMLLDMTEGIKLEMRDALGPELIKPGTQLLVKALEYGPLSKDPEWFNDDENFARVMQQTLYLQHGIVKEIDRLRKPDPHLNLKGWSMRGPSRVLLLAGWVCARSQSSKGGDDASMSIDLRESQLEEFEAVELAELLAKQERLTSVDCRGNESMGMKGAEALAAFLQSGKSSSVLHVPRSLNGVTPAKSTLEVPKHLEPVELRLMCAELISHIFSEGISAGMGNRKEKAAVLNRRGASAASEWQPFLWAVKENHRELAERMLDLGEDINQQQPNTSSSNVFSALHHAAAKGLEEMAEFLIKRGANKALRDKHNNTALMLAEKKQNTKIVTLLGGDPKALRGGAAGD